MEDGPLRETVAILAQHLRKDVETTVSNFDIIVLQQDSPRIHHPGRDVVPTVTNQALRVDGYPPVVLIEEDILVMQIAVEHSPVRGQ